MKHKVKVTVLDKKLYSELQQQYCVFGRAHALAVLMRLSIADGRG